MDYGTICQLLNRKNVPSKPKNDLNAYEDFMLVVGIGHIIAVARQLLQTESFDTTNLTVTEKNKGYTSLQRKWWVKTSISTYWMKKV